MKTFSPALALLPLLLAAEPPQQPRVPANPNIDPQGHLRIAAEAAKHRETHRVTEDEFLRMSREPGTVVLDARSQAKFDLLHVQGAISLSFPDIDLTSLAQTIPDKNTRILIYCNNNFRNEPVAFAPKAKAASLNLSTFATLYGYGYRNVYELGPLLDPKQTKLTLVPTAPARRGETPGR
jgi:rhodanese-related sulfurtransferase